MSHNIRKVITMIVILVVLLLFIILIYKNFGIKLKGGYDNLREELMFQSARSKYTFLQALSDFNNAKNSQMDRICKSACFYLFGKYHKLEKNIRGFYFSTPSTNIKYYGPTYKNKFNPEGGFEKAQNNNDFMYYNIKRYEGFYLNSFIPDFIINIDENRRLIIEFDENNGYHQNNKNYGYVNKNFIYDQMICEGYSINPKVNLSVLRIKYPNNVIKSDENKKQLFRHLFSIIYETIQMMKNNTFQHCYILSGFYNDGTNLKISHYNILKVKKLELLNEFTPKRTVFSTIDLNKTDKIMNQFEKERNIKSFETTSYLEHLKQSLYVHYKGSKAEKYIKTRTCESIIENQILAYKNYAEEIKFIRKYKPELLLECPIKPDSFQNKKIILGFLFAKLDLMFDFAIEDFEKYTIENSF